MSEKQKLLNGLCEELGLIAVDLKLIGDYALDFPQGGQENFNRKINNFVLKLDDISKSSKSEELQDVNVPISVLSYIDADISPAEYNEDLIETMDRLNIKLKCTIKEFNNLQMNLKTELEREFPEEMKKYAEEKQKQMLVAIKNENVEGDKVEGKSNPKNV